MHQTEVLGLVHAVLCAQPVLRNEPFVLMLSGVLLDVEPPVMKQMENTFNNHRCSALVTQNVSLVIVFIDRVVYMYSVIEELAAVKRMVKKPRPAEAPSPLAVVGRYVLAPLIFHHLARLGKGACAEIQLTDGISALLAKAQVLAHRFVGLRYDCGSKLCCLQPMLVMGLTLIRVEGNFKSLMLLQTEALIPNE